MGEKREMGQGDGARGWEKGGVREWRKVRTGRRRKEGLELEGGSKENLAGQFLVQKRTGHYKSVPCIGGNV